MRCTHIVGTALLACALVVTPVVCHAQEEAPADANASLPPITSGEYVAGGLVGTLVGYGIGHAIVGEYGNIGWVFSVSEGLSMVAIIAGYALVMSSALGLFVEHGVNEGDRGRSEVGGLLLIYGGVLAATGFHIWEIVDIWTRPTDRIIKKGAPVAEGPQFGIIPMAFGNNRVGVVAGFSF